MTRKLNALIDGLPNRPPFMCMELKMGGECLNFYCRKILLCVKALFGDLKLKHDHIFAPEQHFTNNEWTCRIYNEMHTRDWWWSVQVGYEAVKCYNYLGMVLGVPGVAASGHNSHSAHTII